MTKQADLIAHLFEGRRHLLSAELLGWMDSSPRFTSFVDTYRDKIRKKLRTAPDAEGTLDVRGELEVAYRLLADRRFEVAYEPYASARKRSPDFAVTYRINQTFNIEVARIRGDGDAAGEVDLPRKAERILRILLDKLEQMQPGMPNLLAIRTGEEVSRAVDLGGLMQALKTTVESKDPAFYAAIRYDTPAAFYRDFAHLSGILLWSPASQMWVNKQSRPALDEKILRAVRDAIQM
jgi:hypothetical protein